MPPVSVELFTVPRTQTETGKVGQLTEAQLRKFFDEGYVIVTDFFEKEDLQTLLKDLDVLVDNLAEKLYNAGKIKDKCTNAGTFQRLIMLNEQFPGAGILLHKRGFPPKSLRDIWASEKLLNVIEQIIGPDISGHPVWNIRCKTPRTEEATVPWHQDTSYLTPEADDVLIPTAWIPLLDADSRNGCMEVLPKGHRKGVTAKHVCCAGGTWYTEVSDEELKKSLGVDPATDSVVCEVPFGGMLLINNLIPHRSLENVSEVIRWSIDLRWHVTGTDHCFHGLKSSIPMRSSTDRNLQVDWSAFTKGEPQHVIEARASGVSDKSLADDEFGTALPGPWMKRWEIVNHNKHTKKWRDTEIGAKRVWHSS